MRVLLDTCVFVWFLEDNPRLTQTAADLIEDSGNQPFVSAISGYEIVLKHKAGAWPGVEALARDGAGAARRAGIEVLPVTMQHSTFAASLTDRHKDPFDRLIAAQSIIEQIPLVTSDQKIDIFGVSVIR